MSSETKIITLRKQGDLFVCTIDNQEFGFRKWPWGEKSKIMNQCIRQTPMGPQLDTVEFNLAMLMNTLKKAPFEIKREILENHPNSQLMDLLVQITTKLNLLGDVEIKNL
jgi:hypothetical protein